MASSTKCEDEAAASKNDDKESMAADMQSYLLSNYRDALKKGDKSAAKSCSLAKIGQETVHDIVDKTTELFNILKTTNSALQRTAENEAKRAKIRDILSSIQYKFDTLRRHYNNVNEICSSLAYVPVKTLIPYKDDPVNVKRTQPEPKEKEELIKKVAEKDEELRKITNELRDFIYEINTMLHISKS